VATGVSPHVDWAQGQKSGVAGREARGGQNYRPLMRSLMQVRAHSVRWAVRRAGSLLQEPRDYGIGVFSEFSDDELA
jgi:hypothetical protein